MIYTFRWLLHIAQWHTSPWQRQYCVFHFPASSRKVWVKKSKSSESGLFLCTRFASLIRATSGADGALAGVLEHSEIDRIA